jgi:polyvinyl alcohol dehydrogenase (cytochrome)
MRGICIAIVVALLAVGCSSSTNPKSAATASSFDCAWPMFGRTIDRTFSLPPSCPTEISRSSVGRLQQKWFFKTRDVVTATPAVVDNTAYVGDWSGRFYALSLDDGSVRWSFDAPPQKQVYSGQIVASAAVADVAGERRVFFASGKTLYALRASDGAERWKHTLHPEGSADDPTEIQSSPVVADGLVIFGFDGHDDPATRAGIVALDVANGAVKWTFDPDRGGPSTGCGGVWSSPSVDRTLGLVYSGSANCVTSPAGWNKYSEAIFALDLHTGEPKWRFQPRGPSNNDFDFAGAPNLFATNHRSLVGLGGKDGVYYALDRASGKVVWKVAAAVPKARHNYSTGGFIGATAVGDGIVVGGTAIGAPCPCLHGIDVAKGTRVWSQSDAAPTFAPTAIANGVAFSGSTTDFTLRAVDLHNGNVLWSQQLGGGIAGGVVVTTNAVIAVAGIREPGVSAAGTDSGVYAFGLGPATSGTTKPSTNATLPPTTVAPPPTVPDPNAPEHPRCISRPCDLDFSLKTPPAGLTPTMNVHLQAKPFRIEARADDLGDPNAWLRAGSPAAKKGAVTYGVFVSDDSLKGSLLCVLDANFDCVNDTVPASLRPSYNRISVLAIANTPTLPSAAEGFDRLVTTISLEQPVSLG